MAELEEAEEGGGSESAGAEHAVTQLSPTTFHEEDLGPFVHWPEYTHWGGFIKLDNKTYCIYYWTLYPLFFDSDITYRGLGGMEFLILRSGFGVRIRDLSVLAFYEGLIGKFRFSIIQ